MTVDEYGTGFPVAFCYSNRVHEAIFTLFFNQTKTKVGIIKSKVFMSDDAPAFSTLRSMSWNLLNIGSYVLGMLIEIGEII